MQAIVSGSCMTQAKLVLIHPLLEKAIIVGKLISLITIMSISVGYLDSYDRKALNQSLETIEEPYSVIPGSNGLAQLVTRVANFGQIIDNYRFEMVGLSFVQFTVTQNASQCGSINCLTSLQANRALYETTLKPVNLSACKEPECKEFESRITDESLKSLSLFGIPPPVYFQVSSMALNLTKLGAFVQELIDNGWLNSSSQQLLMNLIIRESSNSDLSCAVQGNFILNDKLRAPMSITTDCFVISKTQLGFSILLAIIVLVSIAKPMIESSVASTKWIYFISLYIKAFWFTWSILKISTYVTANTLASKGEVSHAKINVVLTQTYIASILLFALCTTLAFECLKLFKRPASYGQFSQLMSTFYGSTLSILSYLVMVIIGYVFLTVAIYLCISGYIQESLPVFFFTFMTETIELSKAPSVLKIFYCIAIILRYLIWLYLVAVFIFYFKLVSTHTFSTFEPKFYKSILDRLSTINKAMDNCSNDTLMKPVSTNKSKRHQVIIWLNFGFHDSSGQRLFYSDAILEIFGEIEKVGIGLSFFNEFREVISFLKSIYNIIPKIIMSTTKSVRIVVRVCNFGNLPRTEFELKVFTKMTELDQFISDMRLDLEILVYDEQIGNVYSSRVYSILESSFAKIKVTNNKLALRRFCQMMPIDEFAADTEEVFNALLDDIDEAV